MQIFKNFSDVELQDRIEEIFFEGIPEDIKAKLAVDGISEYNDILQRIRKAEFHIIRDSQNKQQFHRNETNISRNLHNNLRTANYSHRKNTFYNQNNHFNTGYQKRNTNYTSNYPQRQLPQKTCDIHGPGHSNYECIIQQNQNNNHQSYYKAPSKSTPPNLNINNDLKFKNNKDNNCNNITPSDMIIVSKFDDIELKFQFDSGSNLSFINQQFAIQHDINSIKCDPYK